MEFIESEHTLEALLPALGELVTEGLIVISDVEVIQHTHKK
jgi:PII-like signaling protein